MQLIIVRQSDEDERKMRPEPPGPQLSCRLMSEFSRTPDTRP